MGSEQNDPRPERLLPGKGDAWRLSAIEGTVQAQAAWLRSLESNLNKLYERHERREQVDAERRSDLGIIAWRTGQLEERMTIQEQAQRETRDKYETILVRSNQNLIAIVVAAVTVIATLVGVHFIR